MTNKFKKIPELEELFKNLYLNLKKPLNDKKYTAEEKSKQLMACIYATITAIYREQTPLFFNEMIRIYIQNDLKKEAKP